MAKLFTPPSAQHDAGWWRHLWTRAVSSHIHSGQKTYRTPCSNHQDTFSIFCCVNPAVWGPHTLCSHVVFVENAPRRAEGRRNGGRHVMQTTLTKESLLRRLSPTKRHVTPTQPVRACPKRHPPTHGTGRSDKPRKARVDQACTFIIASRS